MKISELAQATAINAEDVFPVVQGGETKKVSAETIFGDVDSALDSIIEMQESLIDGTATPDGTDDENGSSSDGTNGECGTSVTISSISESTEDGGSNIVTFSDGNTLTIKNGSKGSQGEKGDTGEAGADGYTPVKGTDYFTEADKEKMVSDVIASIDAIPDYWQTALDEGVDAIRQAMETAGRKKSAFLFYSDAHWDYGSKMSPKLLKYLYKNTAINKTFFGGDIVNSEATDRETMEYLYEWREMLRDLPNHHSVVGNHDDGNATNNLFSTNYIYAYLLAAEETPQIVQGSDMYYYIDEPCEKTRYLFLDTAYKGVDNDQITFITEALKSTQSGWHIVVVSHIWYLPDYDQYNIRPIPIAGLDTNASKVITLLDNYNSRIGDFADCDGWVEFCIGGHVHRDYDATTTTGIPIILVETDSQHIRSDLSYTAGTATEASVNGIIADYENHKIYVVRVGRGESREIAVTNYVISYTNVLPFAVDTDGVSVYNGVGYKADTRWSTSNSTEVEASGYYISGYIPCSDGDIVRLKNITLPNEDGNGCLIYYCTSLGVVSSTHNSTNLTKYNNAIWDDNNNLIQFTIDGDFSYFRVQGTYMGTDSIITRNEVME